MTDSILAPPAPTTQAEIEAFILDVLPPQGRWSEEAFLWLTDHSNALVEFDNGHIEVLPMPTDDHQSILKRLLFLFVAFFEPLGGIVQFAPLRLRIPGGKYREPDLLVLLKADDPRRANRFWLGADLVVEVISPDNPDRDRIDKRYDYAETGVSEYWIVDTTVKTITVLRLEKDAYIEHGVFGAGTQATSALLTGFQVSVDAILTAN